MDIIGHLLVGGVYKSGWCMVGSVLPDIVWMKRRPVPTKAYLFTHSLIFAGICAFIHPMLGVGVVLHILLDIPTHGKVFSPRLLYPLYNRVWVYGVEWEYFNKTYKIWMAACVVWFLFHITYLW